MKEQKPNISNKLGVVSGKRKKNTERKIGTMCRELKQKGIDEDMVKSIAGKHYGVEIPDKSKAAVV